MSSNKDEAAQAATDRIKAAALSAAKGLSRAQAERTAAAAARNVNAYGQKEEGPSRWQERKEAKRQSNFLNHGKGFLRPGLKFFELIFYKLSSFPAEKLQSGRRNPFYVG